MAKTLTIQQKQRLLDKISKEIESCEICKQNTIGKAVPGEGNPDADIVFIGEAPGKTEAETGRPFVGRAGKVLRELIKDAGLKDADVYITSPVKRLPVYVTPKPSDIEHGRKHLNKQLDVIQPKIIVLMGNTAVKALLGEDYRIVTKENTTSPRQRRGTPPKLGGEKLAIAKHHGMIIKQDNRTYLIAYHPAAPLYAPKVKAEIIKDFKKLKTIISRS